MKYLRLVDSKDNIAYVSNSILGKIFGTSKTTIEKLMSIRMKQIYEVRNQKFVHTREKKVNKKPKRLNFSDIKDRHIDWLINDSTLENQVGLSL